MTTSGNDNTAQGPLDQLSSVLQGKYSVQLDRLEKRQQHIVPPWWTPPSIRIAKSRDDALKHTWAELYVQLIVQPVV
jgi:hypothetical protein